MFGVPFRTMRGIQTINETMKIMMAITTQSLRSLLGRFSPRNFLVLGTRMLALCALHAGMWRGPTLSGIPILGESFGKTLEWQADLGGRAGGEGSDHFTV